MEPIKMSKLSINMRRLWFTRSAVIIFVLLAVALTGIFILSNVSAPEVFCVIIGALWLVLSVLLALYPALKYSRYSYGYDDLRILICSGVTFRHRVLIPICQIQDLHLYEGPLMMIFKVCGVTLSTAGSNFNLAGLDRQSAKQLVDDIEKHLNKRIEEKRHEEV